MNRPTRAAAVVLVLLVVGGCSSAALDGRGSVAAPPQGSVASPSITSFPTSAVTSPTTTPSSGPSTVSGGVLPTVPSTKPATRPSRTSAPAAPAVKVCASKADPPFCYPLPSGFRDYSYLKNYGKGWTYRTIVSLGRHDLIEVLASREPHSTDALSNSRLTSYYDRTLKAKPGRYSVRSAGPARRVRVEGARAFEQHTVFTNGVRGDTTTVFHGHVILSIGCQSKARTGRVEMACGRVHRSIRIH